MAAIEAEVIQKLLDQIEAIENAVQTAGDEGRNKLRGIKVKETCDETPRTPDGQFDSAAWSSLGEDKQRELYQRLEAVCESLHLAATLDGPIDPHHIMSSEYASNRSVVTWASLSFLLMIFFLCLIVFSWGKA